MQALPSRPALPVGIEEANCSESEGAFFLVAVAQVTTTSSLLESMGPLGVAGQAVAGLAALYIIMQDSQRTSDCLVRASCMRICRSFCEYVYHRYFQHLGPLVDLMSRVGCTSLCRVVRRLRTEQGRRRLPTAVWQCCNSCRVCRGALRSSTFHHKVRAVRSTLNLSTFRGDGHVEHHRDLDHPCGC